MASKPKKNGSVYRLMLRHWVWVIVVALLAASGVEAYRLSRVGLPQGAYLLVPIATNLVTIALVLLVRYVIIGNLVRGVRKGMQQSPTQGDSKADQVASSVGRTTGLYAGMASRILTRGARHARQVGRAGAATIQKGLAERKAERPADPPSSKTR